VFLFREENQGSQDLTMLLILGFLVLQIEPKEYNLLVTEAPFSPSPLPEYSYEVIFEEFGFSSCCKVPAACLSAYKYSNEKTKANTEPDCVTVVDSGFSFTHIVPLYKGKAIQVSRDTSCHTGGLRHDSSYCPSHSFPVSNPSDQRGWETADQFPERDGILPSVPYDG